jgi:hypothetical protein
MIPVGTHRGYEITVDEGDHRFHVQRGEEEGIASADTYDGAVQAIERLISENAKAARKDVALPVYHVLHNYLQPPTIEDATLIGFNRGTGALLLRGVRGNPSKVYVRTPLVKATLNRIHELTTQLKQAEADLRRFEVSRHGYTAISSEDYPQIIAALEKAHADKTARAEANDA